MNPIDAVAVALIVLPLADWIAAVILASVSLRHPHIRTLRERAVTAVVLAVAASAAAVLGATRLHFVSVRPDSAIGVLAIALIAISLPALYWLWLLVSGRLGPPEAG